MRLLIALIFACFALQAATFRAAAVKVDITPSTPQWLLGYGPRQSTGVHDRIFHRVMVLDDGRMQFVLVASDLCLFSPELYDEVAAELEKAGISRLQFWWSVSHTHSAPEAGPPGVYKVLLKGRSDHEWDRQYTEEIKAALVRAVAEARSRLEPALLRVGIGSSLANINRRARDVDGKISLGLNPEGAVDRQLGLIRAARPDGSVIALVANYAIHGTVLGGSNTLISGDAPGISADYVEQSLGGVMLFVNGAAGNAAPIYSVYPTPSTGHLSQFRVLLGDRILETNRAMPKGTGEVAIGLEDTAFETPLRTGADWPPELARYSRIESGGGTLVRLPVRVLRLNGTAIWAAPVELFGEISTQVRSRSSAANTLFFGYTNGWFGYLPTARAFAEGGYEPQTSPFTPSVKADLARHLAVLLEKAR